MATRTVEEQSILNNIVACMKCKNFDQKDLCEYLRVNPQMFTNWKNGHSNSYMRRLPKIAEFFDISVDDLMGKTVISERSIYEEKLLLYFSMCDADGKLRVIQCAMNEFDRTQKEKTEIEEPSAVG